MITLRIENLKFGYTDKILLENINLNFYSKNCYGIIGPNGSGKTTFVKILSKEIEQSSGNIFIPNGSRMSVLSQDQNFFNKYTILDTILSGYKELYFIKKEIERIYTSELFSSEEEIKRLSSLEYSFSKLDGYNIEYRIERILSEMGIEDPKDILYKNMEELNSKIKVKILLARCLFDNPDILILDEPTNNLDISTIRWLEEKICNINNLEEKIIITISHNRSFLNAVCTNICDINNKKISVIAGNYDFWYKMNELMRKHIKEQNKKQRRR